jgi:tetratricopeptide (TPR) repeat protein
MSVAPRLALAALFLPAAASAQIQIDDRPKVYDPGPLTKEQLNRRKADQLLRDARTLYGVGLMLRRHEKLIEAVATLEKAAALDAESLEVRRTLIPLYASLGREPEAMTLCRHVLDRDPHDPETGFQFARLLKADGRTAEAIPVLEKAVATKAAREQPERLLVMLSELTELLENQQDFAAAASNLDALIATMTDKREHLLYGHGFTRDDLQAHLARAYERLGHACVKTKEYDRAAAAFRAARDTLLKSDNPDARHQAVRLHGNLSELLAAQGKSAEALEALDAYLGHSPAEVEPYERKVELLRKLGRDREIIPALRKHAARDQFHLGLQLLLAREMTKDPRTRTEAEGLYRKLLEANIKPDIYRGLFHLLRADDRMAEVIDLLDDAVRAATAKDGEVPADKREAGLERYRAMLSVLRSDPPLVAALIEEARAELTRSKERKVDTWELVAVLAARARKLEQAELMFRQCLINLPPENEHKVYSGLMEVLTRQKKHDAVIKLCRDVLAGRRPARNTNAVLFESSLAGALAAQGEYDAALPHVDKAIKLSSEAAKVRARCQRAEILALAGRYPDAVAECEDTLKEFPQATFTRMVRYTLSNAYSLQGDHAKSEEQLRLILETDPDAPLANNNLGYQMADRNVRLDEAERLIRRAIDADRLARKEIDAEGDNAAYLDSLGWVLFRRGDLDGAREWLSKAAALPDGADDPTVWDHLGDVYARLDDPAKAKDAWRTALKLYRESRQRRYETRAVEVEKKLKSVEG